MTEYERGFRDGITSAANMVDHYASHFGVTGDAARHLYACAEGMRTGVVARDIEGKGNGPDRNELLTFARWLCEGEVGEGHEEEFVEKYLRRGDER